MRHASKAVRVNWTTYQSLRVLAHKTGKTICRLLYEAVGDYRVKCGAFSAPRRRAKVQ